MSKLTETFQNGNLECSDFGHQEHVQVAFDLLEIHPFIDAAAIYCRGIKSIALKANAAGKFNLTITIAFLSIIAERMVKSGSESFVDFAARNQDLFKGNALSPYYSNERLFSDAAREIFLLPDPHA